MPSTKDLSTLRVSAGTVTGSGVGRYRATGPASLVMPDLSGGWISA
jgi:hypothetical protein